MQVSQGDLPPGLSKCLRLSEYEKALLWERTRGIEVTVGESAGISLVLQGELETLVDQVCRAWENRQYLSYTIEEVMEALDQGRGAGGRDARLRDMFHGPYPPNARGSLAFVDVPTVYIDRAGRIIAWYIPGAFTGRRSVRHFILKSIDPLPHNNNPRRRLCLTR